MADIDMEIEYGLVLEGGGAKGAYQIGVWRALKECGVRIKGISGASVGALNGALMCMDCYEDAKALWENIRYSTVMSVEDEVIEKLKNFQLKDMKPESVLKEFNRVVTEHGVDITPLRELIDQLVDEDKIRSSPIEFYMTAINLTDRRIEDLEVSEIPEGQLGDYLLASSYLPVFKREKLHGKLYLDGGILNNVPIDLLLKQDYKNIIVVRIFGTGYERSVKIPDDVNVITIEPTIDLGGSMEFDSKKSKRNMKVGYYDGLRVLKGLIGHIYYIEQQFSERNCLDYFMNIPAEIMQEINQLNGIREEESDYRCFMETVLPAWGKMLRLNKQWNYQELFLGMLELAAKHMRISKYEVYTESELMERIQEKCILRPDKVRESKDLLIKSSVLLFSGQNS